MRKVFTGLFVVTLVLVFCCPLFGSTNDPSSPIGYAEAGEVRGTNGNGGTLCPPDGREDSGLTWYQVAGVLALLGGGGALGWTGCKKMQAIRLEPQPLEVKATPDYVTKREFEEYREEVRENFKGVHARINKNDASTAEIKGQLSVIAANQEKILNILLQRKPQ